MINPDNNDFLKPQRVQKVVVIRIYHSANKGIDGTICTLLVSLAILHFFIFFWSFFWKTKCSPNNSILEYHPKNPMNGDLGSGSAAVATRGQATLLQCHRSSE
jgi:hypothetical protein